MLRRMPVFGRGPFCWRQSAAVKPLVLTQHAIIDRSLGDIKVDSLYGVGIYARTCACTRSSERIKPASHRKVSRPNGQPCWSRTSALQMGWATIRLYGQSDCPFRGGPLFGPGCQLITVEHPVNDHAERAEGWERARPIRIGEDCWFGAGVLVLPGVTVGDRVVVAAGSVVTRDIPSDSLAAGAPAEVKRSTKEQ